MKIARYKFQKRSAQHNSTCYIEKDVQIGTGAFFILALIDGKIALRLELNVFLERTLKGFLPRLFVGLSTCNFPQNLCVPYSMSIIVQCSAWFQITICVTQFSFFVLTFVWGWLIGKAQHLRKYARQGRRKKQFKIKLNIHQIITKNYTGIKIQRDLALPERIIKRMACTKVERNRKRWFKLIQKNQCIFASKLPVID